MSAGSNYNGEAIPPSISINICNDRNEMDNNFRVVGEKRKGDADLNPFSSVNNNCLDDNESSMILQNLPDDAQSLDARCHSGYSHETANVNDSGYESFGATKKTKKTYNKYSHKGSEGQVKARLSEEKYKGILVPYDANSVKCTSCDAILHPSTTSIHRHVITPKHIKNQALKKSETESNAIRFSRNESYYSDYREPSFEGVDSASNLIPGLADTMSTVEAFRPNPKEYERIDDKALREGVMKENFLENHAVHDTLSGQNRVEIYEIYRKINCDELLCILKFGTSINGYPGIVHGGITATIFDNTFGWLLMACSLPPAFTANLNINYRDPIYPNTFLRLKTKLLSVNGRKIIMDASMENCLTGKIVADSTTLFIMMKKNVE